MCTRMALTGRTRRYMLAAASSLVTTTASLSTRAVANDFPADFYFKQLVVGQDFATSSSSVHSLARNMNNYVYVLGDKSTGDAIVVDGAWDPDGIMALVARDNMTLVSFVATHFHWNHIGGEASMGRGIVVPGIKEWSAKGLPVYVPSLELERAATQAGVLESSLSPLGDGQCLRVGRFGVELLHTPGHSPGSTCLRVTDGVPAIATDDSAEDNNTSANASSSEGSAPVDLLLLSGDTVFPGSCGRLDLPGSDPAVMYDSLRRLAALPDNLPIYPGHSYGGESSTIGREKATGFLRNDITRAQWMNSMVR